MAGKYVVKQQKLGYDTILEDVNETLFSNSSIYREKLKPFGDDILVVGIHTRPRITLARVFH